jgi:hypothetical protein
MPRLLSALRDWGSDAFSRSLKSEIERVPTGTLPLAAATTQGGYVDDSKVTATLLSATDDTQRILARVGVFFTEVVMACSCGEDPTEANAYCELQVGIDKTTGDALFSLVKP